MSKKRSDAPPQAETKAVPQEGNVSVKGTFVFAILLGAFIVVSWLVVYFLYLSL